MISFSYTDLIIILLFFAAVLTIGFLAGRKGVQSSDDYLLNGRKLGLFLFILTNVSTWYGGILGVGEFTYRYGLLSWFTQGLPYYIFAILFAYLFAGKIREASLFTIPDKLESVYGKNAALGGAIIIFILISPAPYLLMMGNIISLVFNLDIIYALIISLILSTAYLFKGGYRSDVYTDAFEFFIMFIGFILILAVTIISAGDMNFLKNNLPPDHLTITGSSSVTYIIVWFLIALWTFTDPGFHQRCYAAKNAKVAKRGILISIVLWAFFDFLTTGTGLYARAILPNLQNPVLAFPYLAERILGPGLKGIFYAALIATVLSTLNSFLFLSATTFSRDLIYRLSSKRSESKLKIHTIYGLLISGTLAILLASSIPSVIELWYAIGSLCIPGVILLVISAYYPKYMIDKKWALVELSAGVLVSTIWFFMRSYFTYSGIKDVEPMIAGLTGALVIHILALIVKKQRATSVS